MLNHLVLVGRITHDPQKRILEDGRKVLKFQLAVQRSFKNYEGTYDTDFIQVTAWEGLTTIIQDFCTKGAMLAVKGRVQSWKLELEDKNYNMLEVVAEKVTFLADSKKKLMEEIEEEMF